MNIKLKNLKRSIVALLLLALLPLVNMGVAGAVCTASVGCTSSASTVITVNVNPIIAITNTNSAITLNITPTATGNYSVAGDKVTINTNDVSGYTFQIGAAGGTTVNTSYAALTNGTNVICPSNALPGAVWTGKQADLSNINGATSYAASCPTTNGSGGSTSAWGWQVCNDTTGAPIANPATTFYTNGTTVAPPNCPIYGGTLTATGSGNAAVPAAATFTAMPISTSPYTIFNGGSSSTAITAVYDLVYAAAANFYQPSGNGTQGSKYTATIVYTALTN